MNRISRRLFSTNSASIRTRFDQPWLHPTTSFIQGKAWASFGYQELQRPADLVRVSQSTLRRAELILSRITRSFGPQRTVQENDPRKDFLDCIRAFDRLSDILCRVIDLAESIRNLHPNQLWINAANQAHSLLSRYMNTLNTHKELYDALEFSLSRLSPIEQDHPDLFAAKTVGLQFLRDFQRHGIHLQTKEREKLVDLSDEMLSVGRMFFAGTNDNPTPTWITKNEAKQLGNGFVSDLEFNHNQRSEIDPSDWHAHTLLRQHPDPSVRKRIWFSQRNSTDDQIELLENLLKLRYQFARLTGKNNWADVALEDKMIGNQDNVMAFLNGLDSETRPIALNELKLLQNSSQDNLNPWDRDYYAHSFTSNRTRDQLMTTNLSSYFSVGSCIQGLSQLFSRIYGISFVVESPDNPQELWHESIVKLGVMDEDEGRIGTIYCDLFDRTSKTTGAAHYTVRCSRRTDLDEDHKDFEFAESGLNNDTPIVDHIFPDLANSEPLKVPVTNRNGKPGTYQRPVVVFSCTFDPPDPITRQPSLLAWSDVETLFHEMGHAIHSMIGQTEYHNVSGTRCPTDFVELPSILMEHFARSSEVLSLFASHHTDPNRKLDVIRFKQHLQTLEFIKGIETQSQIGLAALDQHFHSDIVAHNPFNSTLEYSKIDHHYSIYPSSTNLGSTGDGEDRWHARFGHLYGYGASYYSYLFDRVIAQKIWSTLFRNSVHHHRRGDSEDGVLSRTNGERIKSSILKWGGSRDPWKCLEDVIQDGSLADGGIEAVQTVGKWGLWK
ncbi:hypothetical protein Pst134EB_012709 [Puccinia striiformis f. sp. tritici]|uniref:mitochondrial intermediate peptidase n=1 Tax=Puccinia striiformis f. sp. tritici PST-78 TaxID=1165861 RepID=A0A0L0VV14_9BASI|nr:hypothetical protein Pst134EB_012709 [Puccinia striiformis f. sp. tritici]KNF03118.1 hypothetical protein PSTG_03703 [Puccinia striiformis f. sp. tritici PST-78]